MLPSWLPLDDILYALQNTIVQWEWVGFWRQHPQHLLKKEEYFFNILPTDALNWQKISQLDLNLVNKEIKITFCLFYQFSLYFVIYGS
ncbi:hypothetical protein MIDIC_110046 [Alphaproteobacteria bacterium]